MEIFWIHDMMEMEIFCDIILVTNFGDVIMMTSPKWRRS